MNKKNMFKAVVAFAVALAFLLPGAAVIAYKENNEDGTPEPLDVANWPMFRHDPLHTGYSTSTAPDTSNVLWEYTTGGLVRSSPSVADGKIFFGSDDNKVYCLDTDGNKLWSYTTGGAVSSSPAVVDGRVYVGSDDGYVYCLETIAPPTGMLNWKYFIGGQIHSSPAVADGKVYICGSYRVYCLETIAPPTGMLNWRYPPFPSIGPVTSSPAVADGKVYFGTSTDPGAPTPSVICLSTAGSLNWQYNTGGQVHSSPAVADGKVYIGSDDNKVYCFGSEPADPTIVSISPSAQTVEKGETFTVDVYVEPSEPIIGVSFDHLYFDASLVHANSVTEGDLFDPHATFFIAGAIDNGAGEIGLTSGVTVPVQTVTDPGTFCTIEFTAQQQLGTSDLDLEGVLVSDAGGSPTPITVNDGEVTVEEYFDLTMSVVGSGTTTPASPGVYGYASGTIVDLEAFADSCWAFAGWSGDKTGMDNPTTITMDDGKAVTATFTEIYYDLTISIVGSGTTTPAAGVHSYPCGTVVDLEAFPAGCYEFAGWSGDITTTDNPTTITMDDDKAVTATFTEIYYDLTISIVGSGTTTPAAGVYSYLCGTVVPLEAFADPSWSFSDWSGDITTTDNPTDITMDDDKIVTATFKEEWLAEITIEGTLTPPLRIDMIDYVIFGEKATASDGVDGHDLPYPGTPPAPYVAGWFMTDFDYPYDELENDIRHYPAIPPNGKIWDLWVETDTAGNGETALITMTWDNTILAGNEYDYVILRDYLSGDTLADMRATGTFVFTADHGTGYHFQIICGFNHCPVGVDDEYDTNENTPLIVAAPGVLDNDIDLDGDPIWVLSGSLVYSGPGSVGLSTDGSFEYTPAVGWTGTDSFTYEVTDGVCSDEATVTINVIDLKGIDVNVGWNLISMPAYEDLFDKTNIVVEYLGDYYTWAEAIANDYILPYTYGWSGGAYANYDDLTRGDGYWLWAYVDCILLIPSDAVAENHITTFDEGEGWYLVGAPYTSDLAKWQTRIHHDGIYHTWGEAVADGHILAYLYDWDRAAQNYVLSENPDFFGSGRGYWMYVYDPCSLKKA